MLAGNDRDTIIGKPGKLTGLPKFDSHVSGVDSGGVGGARAPLEFESSEKGRSLISAFRSLAITASTPQFEKLSTALL